MAGPLGGLELVYYLLLSGGWKPVTGLYFCFLRVTLNMHRHTIVFCCSNIIRLCFVIT